MNISWEEHVEVSETDILLLVEIQEGEAIEFIEEGISEHANGRRYEVKEFEMLIQKRLVKFSMKFGGMYVCVTEKGKKVYERLQHVRKEEAELEALLSSQQKKK